MDSLELIITLDASVVGDSPDPYLGLLKISWGIGAGPLDSLTLVPVFMTVPCFDTSYTAQSSDSVSGPNFEWIEITETGTKIPHNIYYNQGSAPLDDGSAGPFYLGFDFPFFGVDYNEMWVGVNGAISFSDSAVNANGYYDQLSIPGAPFSTFVAPFWNDLTIDPLGGGHGDIYFKHLPNFRYAITWDQIGNFNSADDTLVTFQVILEKNGDISVNYLNVGTSGLSQTALIGLQAAGCSAENYYDQGVPASLEVSDSSSVLFEYTEIVTELAGDANRSGSIDIGDAIFLITYIFKDGAAPDPIESGDPNCSGAIDISDALFIVLYIFRDGDTPCEYQI
ncbi:MAG: hypothetical protein IIB00_06275 [candidate division Zixibacteria bacterium]|nr:hypothetical protein [candidate division Zixibacteria bacterium]